MHKETKVQEDLRDLRGLKVLWVPKELKGPLVLRVLRVLKEHLDSKELRV